jgi:hypothetical protein
MEVEIFDSDKKVSRYTQQFKELVDKEIERHKHFVAGDTTRVLLL